MIIKIRKSEDSDFIFSYENKEYLISIPNKKKGIIGIKNYSQGFMNIAHPNIDSSGSVSGMKKLGYWGKTDKIEKVFGCNVNKSKIVISDEIDNFIAKMENNELNFYEVLSAFESLKENEILNIDLEKNLILKSESKKSKKQKVLLI